jgi:hypothetical protein
VYRIAEQREGRVGCWPSMGLMNWVSGIILDRV